VKWIALIVTALVVGAVAFFVLHRGDELAAPAGQGFPRADARCAARADEPRKEPRPGNRAANHSSVSSAVRWSTTWDNMKWKAWTKKRSHVTGRFKGTTDQIFSWAGCKWGLNADVLRAVAAQESDWEQGTVGDGGASFGIMQVKDHYPDGRPAWGGFPDTLRATALNVDFYGAYVRSCIDGDFYDGGQWLYRGQTIAQVVQARGATYALWGCVGSWFSGEWYDAGARDYVAKVKRRLATRNWPSSSSS
jgi:autotransporter family porin